MVTNDIFLGFITGLIYRGTMGIQKDVMCMLQLSIECLITKGLEIADRKNRCICL